MSDEKKQKGLFKSLSELSFVKKLKSIKHIEIIILVIFILILLLICFSGTSVFSFFNTTNNEQSAVSTQTTYTNAVSYSESLENKLKQLLSSIKNAGNIEVMVSIDGSSTLTFATEQIVTSNGQTTQTETKIIYVENNGVSSPIIINEKLPKINGVVVVSSGANDVNVRLNILQAVQIILDIEASKIQIFAGN